MAGNTKLPASDDLEDHPHPFRDMTLNAALTRSFLRSTFLGPCQGFLDWFRPAFRLFSCKSILLHFDLYDHS